MLLKLNLQPLVLGVEVCELLQQHLVLLIHFPPLLNFPSQFLLQNCNKKNPKQKTKNTHTKRVNQSRKTKKRKKEKKKEKKKRKKKTKNRKAQTFLEPILKLCLRLILSPLLGIQLCQCDL